MNVLMFGWEYPPHISGGLGTACQGLVKGLGSYNDINVTFVVPRTYGDEDADGIRLVSASGVELTGQRLRSRLVRIRKTSKREFRHYSAYSSPGRSEMEISDLIEGTGIDREHFRDGRIEFTGRYSAGLFDEVTWYGLVGAEIAGSEKYDLIHAHDWLAYPAGIEAKKASGKPLVVHVHATEFDRSGLNTNKRILEIERKGMEAADKVIAVSNFTRRTIIDHYGIDARKVVAVHNAVGQLTPVDRFISGGSNIKEHIVTFLGRITWQKGPEYFVQAARKVLQKMDNVRFVMAGSGDMMERMMNFAAKLKIADRFNFTGFLKGSDVTRMYSASDLFIMPSVSEPFGISPLEAIQCGVPVIISRQSGVSEVLRHVIKIDFWDIDAMADAIYGILNYPEISNHLRHGGRNDVSKLKWVDAAGRVREIYYQVASLMAA
jgi:glycosyltransferase involved in cell wall biosynthesis